MKGTVRPNEVVLSIEKFQHQKAVNIAAPGSYTIPNWYDCEGRPRTFACRTRRVSPFRMTVDVPVIGKLGSYITTYFPDFGKLEGIIDDRTGGGFLLELIKMDPAMRQKMADKLTWLQAKKNEPAVTDQRRNARIVPIDPHSILTFGDGTTCSCFVIDMSIDGVAVSAEVQPDIGTPLAVGVCVGRVVRLLPNGFAVRFEKPQVQKHLNQLVTRSTVAKGAATVLNEALAEISPDSSTCFLV